MHKIQMEKSKDGYLAGLYSLLACCRNAIYSRDVMRTARLLTHSFSSP